MPDYFANMKARSTTKDDFVRNVPLKQATFKDRFIFENQDPGYFTPQQTDCEDKTTTYFLSPRKVVRHTKVVMPEFTNFTIDTVYVFT